MSTTPPRCPLLLKPHELQLSTAGAGECAATGVRGAWTAPAQGHGSLQTDWWGIRWQREVTLKHRN